MHIHSMQPYVRGVWTLGSLDGLTAFSLVNRSRNISGFGNNSNQPRAILTWLLSTSSCISQSWQMQVAVGSHGHDD